MTPRSASRHAPTHFPDPRASSLLTLAAADVVHATEELRVRGALDALADVMNASFLTSELTIHVVAGNGSALPLVTQPTAAGTSLHEATAASATMWCWIYVVPVIFTFGIVGNCVSFVVFLSQKMRRVSTNIYLAALCASNGFFLMAVAVTWTDFVGLKLIHTPILCQTTVYLTYCSGFLSVWLVVCITVENFVINFFLHKASKHCTVGRALCCVAFLSVTALLLYDFAIWTTGLQPAADDGGGGGNTSHGIAATGPSFPAPTSGGGGSVGAGIVERGVIVTTDNSAGRFSHGAGCGGDSPLGVTGSSPFSSALVRDHYRGDLDGPSGHVDNTGPSSPVLITGRPSSTTIPRPGLPFEHGPHSPAEASGDRNVHSAAADSGRLEPDPPSDRGRPVYCYTLPGYQPVVEVFTVIDIFLTLLIPTAVILALVVPTCIKNISCSARGESPARVMLSRKERALLRVTRLLCVIIVSFVVLTVPSNVIKLRHVFHNQSNIQEELVVVLIGQMFFTLSFSMNFVYFLIWGKNFRGRFCHLFVVLHQLACRCRRKFFPPKHI